MTDASRMVLRAEQDKQQLRSFLRWWNLHLPNDVHVAMTDLCVRGHQERANRQLLLRHTNWQLLGVRAPHALASKLPGELVKFATAPGAAMVIRWVGLYFSKTALAWSATGAGRRTTTTDVRASNEQCVQSHRLHGRLFWLLGRKICLHRLRFGKRVNCQSHSHWQTRSRWMNMGGNG